MSYHSSTTPRRRAAPLSHGLGRVLARFDFDVQGARQLAAMRLVGAGFAALGGLWLVAVASHGIHYLFGAAALCAAFGWTRAFRRGRERAARCSGWHLLVRERGIERVHGNDVQRVGFDQLCAVDLDEERLVIVLRRAEEKDAALEIEPLYRSGGLEGLYATLRTAADQAWGPARAPTTAQSA